MKTRDQLVTEIRPKIKFDETSALPMEKFQGNCLRPILKLQNPLFIQTFLYRMEAVKTRFPLLSEKEKAEKIRNSLQNDHWVRQRMLGLVSGLFTEDEMAFYYQNETEVNRRVVSMLIERLTDQLVAKVK